MMLLENPYIFFTQLSLFVHTIKCCAVTKIITLQTHYISTVFYGLFISQKMCVIKLETYKTTLIF